MLLVSTVPAFAGDLIDVLRVEESKPWPSRGIDEKQFPPVMQYGEETLMARRLIEDAQNTGSHPDADAEQLGRKAVSATASAYGVDHPRTGLAHIALAEILRKLGKFDEAQNGLDAAAAIWERTLPPDHFYRHMLLTERADLESARGRHDEALALLHRAAQFEEATTGSADIDFSYTRLQWALDAAGRANSGPCGYEQDLLALRRQDAAREDDPAAIRFLVKLARCQASENDVDAANISYRRAMSLWSGRFPADEDRVTLIEKDRLDSFIDLPDANRAEAEFRAAISAAQSANDARRTGFGLSAYASLLQKQSRLEEAIAIERMSVRALDKAGRVAVKDALIERTALANILAETGQFGEAEKIAGEAMAALETLPKSKRQTGDEEDEGDDDSAEVSDERFVARFTLAYVLRQKGDLENALLLAEQLRSDPEARQDDELGNMYGGILLRQGKIEDAYRAFRDAATQRSNRLGKDHVFMIPVLANLADARSRTGRTGIFEAKRSVDIYRSWRDRQSAASSGAADRYRYALETLVEVGWREKADASRSFEYALGAAQDLTTSSASRAMAKSALRVTENGGELSGLISRQDQLIQDVAVSDRRYMKLVGMEGADEAGGAESAARRVQAEGARRQELLRQLETVTAQINTAYPAFANLINPQPLHGEEIQKRLAPDEALLLMVPANEDLYVFAVSPTVTSWNRLEGGVARVAADVGTLRCQMDPYDRKSCGRSAIGLDGLTPFELRGYPAFDRQRAYALYRDLIAPIETALPGVRHLYVTASGTMADLPIELLITDPPAAGDDADPDVIARSRWLGDKYAVMRLPSVALLGSAAEPAQPPAGMVGYGAPALAGPSPKLAHGGCEIADRGMRVGKQRDRAGGAIGSGHFMTRGADGQALADPKAVAQLCPLPNSSVELEALSKTVAPPLRKIALGADATETALKADRQISGAKIVAFATHGLMPLDMAGLAEPALVFTPPERASANDDGLLLSSEVAGLSFNADLVILSACNTALADGKGGGESLSAMARSFLYAGARALLASYWRVSDEATSALTVEYVRSQMAGADRFDSLQQAERAIRTGQGTDGKRIANWQPDWAHPVYWAPFSVISAGSGSALR